MEGCKNCAFLKFYNSETDKCNSCNQKEYRKEKIKEVVFTTTMVSLFLLMIGLLYYKLYREWKHIPTYDTVFESSCISVSHNGHRGYSSPLCRVRTAEGHVLNVNNLVINGDLVDIDPL